MPPLFLQVAGHSDEYRFSLIHFNITLFISLIIWQLATQIGRYTH